jgi:hypothetical protein
MKRPTKAGEGVPINRVFGFVVRLIAAGLLIAVTGLAVVAATSTAAQKTTAKVLGGEGTIKSPLRIEVSGDVGLTGLIDSLLPYRGLPAVQIEYRNLTFSIPGINDLFIGHPWAALAFLVISIIAFFLALVWGVLALFGKRLVLADRK